MRRYNYSCSVLEVTLSHDVCHTQDGHMVSVSQLLHWMFSNSSLNQFLGIMLKIASVLKIQDELLKNAVMNTHTNEATHKCFLSSIIVFFPHSRLQVKFYVLLSSPSYIDLFCLVYKFISSTKKVNTSFSKNWIWDFAVSSTKLTLRPFVLLVENWI